MVNNMLDGLTALDLTDEKGCLCGGVLATLGARVIKVEKLGGSTERNIGPFCGNHPDPESSLFWLAYNSKKLGVTLDIETPDGQELFRGLARKVDFVLECFPAGYMDSLQLGYDHLSAINPGIIVTSITHFGQAGPYHGFKGCDIVDLALGGHLFLSGDPDRPPLRISYPQAYLHGSSEAAVATLMANCYREATGIGQHVDVSIQESIVKIGLNAIPFWETCGMMLHREGPNRLLLGHSPVKQIWPCQDGFVDLMLGGGPTHARSNRALTAWMDSVGMADEFFKNMDWEAIDMTTITQETLDRLQDSIGRAFLAHTKKEICKAAQERGFLALPVFTAGEVVENEQLRATGFFSEAEYPCKPGVKLPWPGAFVRSSACRLDTGHSAPSVGEHNQQVYGELLGLSAQEIISLRERGVV